MLKALFPRAKVAAALLALAAMGAVVPAHALVVSGSWDPPIGGEFRDVSWSGEATFSSPGATSCVGVGNCDPEFYYIDSAIVRVTDGNDIETIAWDKRYLGAISSMSFTADGLVDGVESELSMFLRPRNGPWLVDQSFFALSFFSSASGGGLQARLTYSKCTPDGPWETVTVGGSEYQMFEGKACRNATDNDGITYPAYVTGEGFAQAVQAVPEPQTYALTLAAIAAMGLVALRRRRVLTNSEGAAVGTRLIASQ